MGELESVKKFLKNAWPFLVLFAACLAFNSYAKAKRTAWNRIKNPETVQALKQFIAAAFSHWPPLRVARQSHH
jgi:hypothetical protein